MDIGKVIEIGERILTPVWTPDHKARPESEPKERPVEPQKEKETEDA